MMTEIRPSVMLNACVAGIAALLVGCSGNAAPTPDPFAIPAAPAPVVKVVPKSAVPEASLTMMAKFWEGGHGGPAMVSVPVKSIEACQNAATEVAYLADGPKVRASCVGADGIPVARFVCKAETQGVTCTPTRTFQ